MFLGREYVEPGMASQAVPGFCSIGAGMYHMIPTLVAKNECASSIQCGHRPSWRTAIISWSARLRSTRMRRNVGTSLEPFAGNNPSRASRRDEFLWCYQMLKLVGAQGPQHHRYINHLR
jgi:hypothetical protein